MPMAPYCRPPHLLEVNHIPYAAFVLAEEYQNDVYRNGEENIVKQRR